MDIVLKYRGRAVDNQDLAFIQSLIHDHPQAHRRALSLMLCEAWNWRQENGELRDMVCRSLLLQLHRAGHITLPPSRQAGRKPPDFRKPPPKVDLPSDPLEGPLNALGPIQIRQVRRTPEEATVNSLVHQHHYLGYVRPVGEHLKYLVTAKERPIGCFLWSSAPRHLGPRDRYIGWSKEARKANIRFIAYQVRFLIVPWVRVPCLASHLLGRMSQMLSLDWERIYAHPIYFVETFVDPLHYKGTCYRAANWTELGETTGRGKDAPTHTPTRSIKKVFGYALVKEFRQLLSKITAEV